MILFKIYPVVLSIDPFKIRCFLLTFPMKYLYWPVPESVSCHQFTCIKYAEQI